MKAVGRTDSMAQERKKGGVLPPDGGWGWGPSSRWRVGMDDRGWLLCGNCLHTSCYEVSFIYFYFFGECMLLPNGTRTC